MAEDETQFKENTQITQEDPLQSSYHVWGMQQNSDVIYDFLMGLRGYFWDKHEKKYVQFRSTEENFNEHGLKDLYTIMHSVVNRSNVLANLDQKRLNWIMLRTMTTIIKNLTRNKKRWELKEHARDSIIENCKNQLLLFLTKTIDGQGAELMFGTGYMQETIKHDDSFDQANGLGGLGR